jgi:hypothetical protein
MQSVSFSFKHLYKNIIYIIKNRLLNNSDVDVNTLVTINYGDDGLNSVSIEGITENIFTEENYSLLDNYQKEDLTEYFNGLLIIHKEADKDLNNLVYYFLTDSSEFNNDSHVVYNIYDNSDVRINKLDNIVLFKFNEEEIYLTNTSQHSLHTLDQDDFAFPYLSKCLEENSFITYDEYIEDLYSYDIKNLSRELSRYDEDYFYDNNYDNIRHDVAESEDVFDIYDTYLEETSTVNFIVEEMYNKGMIPLSLKNQLFELDEDTYEKIVSNMVQNISITLDNYHRSYPDKEYTVMTSFPAYVDIYINEREIEELSNKYEVISWLTESKLSDMLPENTPLSSSDLFNALINKTSIVDSTEIYVTLSIEYEDVLKIISDESLPFNSSSNRKDRINKLLTSERNPDADKNKILYEKRIKFIKDNELYRLASLLGEYINYDMNSKITGKDIKNLSNSNPYIKKLLTMKSVPYVISNFPKGFSIKDLRNIDITTYDKGSLFQYFVKEQGLKLEDFLDIDVISYKWTSSLQTITDKYNYVFQLNIKREYFNKVLDVFNVPEENRQALKDYHKLKHAVHPVQNNSKYVSLGWIRYTVRPKIKFNKVTLDGVLLDEVQSDLDNFEYLGRDIMKGWQYIIVRKFIEYVKKNLGYTKIYMPDIDVKVDHYNAFRKHKVKNEVEEKDEETGEMVKKEIEKEEVVQKYTANLLYKQLPSSFAFIPSKVKGFYLLEKIKKPKIKVR